MKLAEEAIKDTIKEFFTTFRGELLLIAIAIIILISSVVFFTKVENSKLTDNAIEIESVEEDNMATKSAKVMFAYIAGSVEKPDVYELPENSRLRDLLQKAGGLSKKADRQYFERNFNLAETLADGEKIYIPSLEEVENGLVAESKPFGSVKGQTSSASDFININSASASELDTLSGVGAVTAEKIIASRPYSSIQELLDKKVVGKATFEKIKEKITVE